MSQNHRKNRNGSDASRKRFAAFFAIVLMTACGFQPGAHLKQATEVQVEALAEVPVELIDIELCHRQNPLNEAGPGGFMPFLPPDALLCRGRPDLIRLFDGMGVLFGTMSVVCSFPGVMQVGLPVSAVGSATMSILAFGLKGVECDEPNPSLSQVQEQQVGLKVCELMGKKYYRGFGPTDHSHCL
ncbi:MAG: hypothetical protein EBU49_00380 [Proteobacteria bacterium]|nr:hypothetical protein [Pseudomonadota bacterium]